MGAGKSHQPKDVADQLAVSISFCVHIFLLLREHSRAIISRHYFCSDVEPCALNSDFAPFFAARGLSRFPEKQCQWYRAMDHLP